MTAEHALKHLIQRVFYALIAITATSLTAANCSAQLVFSDFGFGSGTPFGGTTTVDGVGVTLSSTNTEPLGATIFRDQIDPAPTADVTFMFDRAISDFALDVFALDRPSGEALQNFNIGVPTTVISDPPSALAGFGEGILDSGGGTITTTSINDKGSGRIVYSGLNTTTVTFQIVGDALGLSQFGISRFLNDPTAGQLVGSMAQVGIYRHALMFRMLSNEIHGLSSRSNNYRNVTANYSFEPSLASASHEPIVVRGQAPTRSLWRGFVRGYGSDGDVEGDATTPGLSYGLGGTMAGLYRNVGTALVGLYGGYAYQSIDLDTARRTSGNVNSGDFGGFVFNSDSAGNYYILAGNVFYDGYRTRRDTNTATARGEFDGVQTGVYLERGWKHYVHGICVRPSATVHYIYLHQDDFTETGAGANNATVDATNTHSLRSNVGVLVNPRNVRFNRGILSPEFGAKWMHEYLDTSTGVTSGFGGNPAFRTNGASLGRDWAVLQAGLNYHLGRHVSLFGRYEAMVNDQAAFHNGNGGLQCIW